MECVSGSLTGDGLVKSDVISREEAITMKKLRQNQRFSILTTRYTFLFSLVIAVSVILTV